MNLGKEEKKILKLKAAMWEGRNEERLLSKAIRAYRDPKADYQPLGSVAVVVGSKKVMVENVPLVVDEDGQVYHNLHLTSTIEEILEEIYGENPPETVDFRSFFE